MKVITAAELIGIIEQGVHDYAQIAGLPLKTAEDFRIALNKTAVMVIPLNASPIILADESRPRLVENHNSLPAGTPLSFIKEISLNAVKFPHLKNRDNQTQTLIALHVE
jgi:hypothetical protein